MGIGGIVVNNRYSGGSRACPHSGLFLFRSIDIGFDQSLIFLLIFFKNSCMLIQLS